MCAVVAGLTPNIAKKTVSVAIELLDTVPIQSSLPSIVKTANHLWQQRNSVSGNRVSTPHPSPRIALSNSIKMISGAKNLALDSKAKMDVLLVALFDIAQTGQNHLIFALIASKGLKPSKLSVMPK